MSISQEDALVGNTTVLEIACANTQRNMMWTICLSPWDMSPSMETGLSYIPLTRLAACLRTQVYFKSVLRNLVLYTQVKISAFFHLMSKSHDKAAALLAMVFYIHKCEKYSIASKTEKS